MRTGIKDVEESVGLVSRVCEGSMSSRYYEPEVGLVSKISGVSRRMLD